MVILAGETSVGGGRYAGQEDTMWSREHEPIDPNKLVQLAMAIVALLVIAHGLYQHARFR